MPFGLSVGEIAIVLVGLAIAFGFFLFIAVVIVRTAQRFSAGLRGGDAGPRQPR